MIRSFIGALCILLFILVSLGKFALFNFQITRINHNLFYHNQLQAVVLLVVQNAVASTDASGALMLASVSLAAPPTLQMSLEILLICKFVIWGAHLAQVRLRSSLFFCRCHFLFLFFCLLHTNMDD